MNVNYISLGSGRDTKLKRTWQRKLMIMLFFVLFGTFSANAQFSVTTNGGSGLAGTYSSLAAAITALNSATITSPVVITCPTGTETAPIAGYVITATGTASNTITIQGNGAANSIITAFSPQASGVKTDAIIKIVGGDYITIQGFRLQENAANTTTAVATNNMTEIGIGLWLTSATDGAQNNTIQNNTITLGSTYQNAIGVLSSSASSSTNGALAASATTGTNSFNKVYGNTISSVAYGVYVISPVNTSTLIESGWDIGGASATTANSITFGNVTTSDIALTSFSGILPAGITFRNANAGNSVRFNTITSNSLAYTQTGGLGGIVNSFGTAPSGVTYTSSISSNTIVLTNSATTALTGIDFGFGVSTGTIIGNTNNITLNQNGGAATSATLTGIKANYTSATNTLNGNTVVVNQNQSVGANTSAVTAINAAGAGTTVNVGATGAGNTISIKQAISGSGSFGVGAITYINVNAASGTVNVQANTLNTTGSTIRSTGTLVGVFQDATVTTLVFIDSNVMNVDRTAASGAASFHTTSGTPSEVKDIITNNNITITNLSGTSTCTAIASGGGPSSPAVNNKTIDGNTISVSGTNTGAVIGISCSFTNTGFLRNNSITLNTAALTTTALTTSSSAVTISGNTVNLTSSAIAPTFLTGLVASGTGAHSITNNTFAGMNLTGVITTTPTIAGINVQGGTAANVFSNTVNNFNIGAAGSTGSAFLVGVFVSGGTSVNIFKNKIYGLASLCTGASTGLVNGIIISGASNTIYNNLIGGLTASASASPDAIRGISITSTAATTTNSVYNNTIFLNAASSGANFGTSGIFHAASATATTATLDLRNNIIINSSTPSGTGLVVAFRRSVGTAGTLANYSANSNRNSFYAGTPGASNLIYSDGTSTAQTMANYTGGVFTAGTIAPRDNSSFSETFAYGTAGTFFTSVTGSSSTFLQPVAGLTTQAESGGSTIAVASPDYNGVTRPASPGVAYDLGAWEFAGVSPAPSITFTSATPALTTQCTKANRVIVLTIVPNAGTITAATLTYSYNGVAQTPVSLTNTSGNLYTATIVAPATGNAAVTYTASATNSIGLTVNYTGTGYSDEPLTGLTATASASLSTVCSGSPTILSALLTSGTGPATIGTGTTLTSDTTQPTAFCNRWPSYRMQTIYTAAELQAAGLIAGPITAMAFNINTLGDGATNPAFVVKIGTTSLSVLSGAAFQDVTAYTTVFPSATYTHTATGFQTIPFSTPFVWDGTSNIIVDMVHNGADITNNSQTFYTATTTNMVAYTSTAAANAPSFSTQRLNTRFTGNLGASPSAITWSNGTSNVGSGNGLSVSPLVTTTYTPTLTYSGCPIAAPGVTVTVNPLPTAPTASGTLTQCGTKAPSATTLTMVDPNGFTTPTFKFYAALTGGTALQSSTSATYNTSISATTNLFVSVVNPSTSCESARTSVTITVGSALPVSISGNPASVCPNGTVTATASGSYPTYSWTVTPNDGTGGFTGTFAGASLSTVPTTAGTYVYTVSNTDGDCTAVNSFTLTVTPPPFLAITPSAATVCNGASVTLTAQTTAIGNGPVAIGTGTDVSTLSTDGTPYRTGNTIGNQFKNQFLITASELTAAGLLPGAITALKLDVAGTGGGTLSNLTIRMAHSALTAMTTTYVTGLTQVYTVPTWPTTGTLTTGLQTHTFDTPFTWDGTSNLVIEVCAQLATSGSSGTLRGNTTSFVSHILNNASTTGCSTTTSTTSSVRPNIVLNGQSNTLGVGSLTYSWNDPSATTGNVLTVSPSATTTYTVTGFNPATGCSGTKNVVVTVNPAPTAPTFTGTLTQCGTKVPNGATLTVVDPNAFTTPTFKWYAAASGGTALQSSTSATYNTSVAATTTFYVSVVNPTTSCESARASVTLTVTTPPTVTITPASATTFCAGAPVTSVSVTAASSNDPNYTYSWTASPSTGSGLSGTVTGATQTLAPTAAGTYVYTVAATDATSGCITTQTISVTRNAAPVFTSVSASPAAVCANGIATLTASSPTAYSFAASTGATLDPMVGATSVLASGDDDTPTATPAAIGFPFVLNGVSYTQYSVSPDGWVLLGATTAASQFTNAITSTTNAPKLAPYWDDLSTGTNGSVKTLVTGTAPNRIFVVQWNVAVPRTTATGDAANSTFQAWLYETSGKIEYRYGTMGVPTSGTISAGYTISATNFNSISFASNSASTTTANDANTIAPVSGTMYSYTPVPATIVWSPNTDLYTDAAATILYNGTSATSVVYAKPAATTVYTATITSAVGCTATQTVTVTQNAPAIANITGGANTICLGSPTIPATVDFDSTVGASWNSSNTAIATVDGNGVVTPLAAGTTVISAFVFDPISGCTSFAANPQTVTVYAPLAITTNPANASVLDYDGVHPSTTTFTASASGSVVGYQWQVSTTGVEGTFSNLSNTAPYSGVNTATLSIANATTALDGLYFRLSVIGNSPCASPVNSANALLTVSDVEITSDPVFGTPICTSGDRTVTVGISGPTGTTEVWQYSDDNGGTWTTIDGSSIDLLTFTGDVNSTSLEIHNITSVNNGWLLRVAAISGATVVFSNPTTIVVNQPAVINTAGNPVQNQTVCAATAGSATFTVSTTGGTSIQWQYSTDGSTWFSVSPGLPVGATYTGANAATLTVNVSTALVAGPHYYRARVLSAAGCPPADSNTAQLIINTPTVNVSGSDTHFCSPSGTAVTLTASGTATSYSWSPAAGLNTTSGATVIATPTASTTYTVTGTEAGGCTKTAQFTVNVGQSVIATATATPSTVCPNTNVQLQAVTPVADATGFNFIGSTGTYTAITGTTLGAASIGDDVGVGNLPIGFTFNYNGVDETVFAASSNGFIQLGNTTASITGFSANSLSGTAKVIAPFWDDNNTTGGSIIYATTGIAPNRVLTVQWTNMHVGGSGSSANPTISVQAILKENGDIQFVYGPKSAALSAPAASVGISTTVGTFKSITPLSPITSSTTSSVTENTLVTEANLPSGTIISLAKAAPVTYTYLWSPSTFIEGQETVANPTTAAITATTTYSVLITSSDGCSTTATTTVTVQSGATITTQPVSSVVCNGQNATFSVVANGAGISYQWFNGATPITGATLATLTLNAVTLASAGSYSVVITPTCGTPVTSNTVTLTVNPLPTATISGNASVCVSATSPVITFTGANGTAPYTFTYKIGAGTNQTVVSNGSGVATVAAPTTVAGSFVYTLVSVLSASTCTQVQSGTATVNVSAAPTAITINGSNSMCFNDAPVLLTATGGVFSVPANVLSENFNGTAPGWTVTSSSSVATVNWALVTAPLTDPSGSATFSNFTTVDGGKFAMSNSDVGGSGSTTNTVLTSPAFSTVGLTAATLTFEHAFRNWVNDSTVKLEISTDGGTTWSQLVNYLGTSAGSITNNAQTTANASVSLNSYLGQSNVKIRYNYVSPWGYYWILDNVQVNGVTTGTSITWASTNGGLFTNAAGTTPYTGGVSTTVYAKPSVTSSITATSTSTAGCSTSANITLTVNPGVVYYADADGDGFGNAAVTTASCTGAPAGYVSNNTDCDDTNNTKWQSGLLYIDADGDGYTVGQTTVCYGASAPTGYSLTSAGTDCDDTNASITVCASGLALNVKMFVQGYYVGGGLMNSVRLNQDFVSDANNVEMMTVELHDASTYALVASTTAMLHTDGTLSASFASAAAGSYYIAIKGSNIIQTWSAAPYSVSSTASTYDFTTGASQAYGDNMVDVGSGVYAMYSGDITHDDSIDLSDYSAWETDFNAFAFGEFITDLNGDGSVDLIDYSIWEGNFNNFIFAFYPN